MKYLLILSILVTASCSNTDRYGYDCKEFVGEEYLNTKFQIKQIQQETSRAARVEETARSKCEEAMRTYRKNTYKDFRPACRKERSANIALQDKLKKQQNAYIDAYKELNQYKPECNQNDKRWNTAVKQREFYKEEITADQAKIDSLKDRFRYIGAQFATLNSDPDNTPSPKAATPKSYNLISTPPSAATRLKSITSPSTEK